MKTKLKFLLLGAFTLTVISCDSENNSDNEANSMASKQAQSTIIAQPVMQEPVIQNPTLTTVTTGSDLPGNSPCFTTGLLAGQRYDAGEIRVYFDADKVYVEYETSSNWYLRKTNLYIGDCALLPVNRIGQPTPDRFTMRGTHTNETQTVVYTMPRIELPKCFCISANAEVYNMENGEILLVEDAWSYGERFGEGSWGMYFSICQGDCAF